jgi:TRAP-type C4-dicarboxylate transport system substrate-binding protein
MGRLFVGMAGALALAATLSGGAWAQDKFELKLAYFVGDQHAMSKWLIKWSQTLEQRSSGRITVKRFPAAQLGPTQQHYDFARTGQADAVWFLHGGTPGRFPLTELINLPYLVGSAEIGTKVLNDPLLRSRWLDAEHRGVKVLMLFTHTPGHAHTAARPIRTLEDFKGLRIRFASPTVRDFVAALGATPVGVPPTEMAEQLQKGTIDGVFIDYGGAGIAFKLGGIVKHTIQTYSYVTSFGLAMNPAFYAKLPPDLQALVVETTTGMEKEVGEAWDGLDAPGKQALVEGGDRIIELTREQDGKFRAVGAQVTAAKIKELEAKGLPARAVYERMRALSEQYAKSSKSFWK